MATLFDNDFEENDWLEWTNYYTDGGYLTIAAAAALAGTNYGMKAETHGTYNALYCYDSFTATKRCRTRFYLNVANLGLGNYQSLSICVMSSAAQATARLRLYNNDGTLQMYGSYHNDVPTEIAQTYYTVTGLATGEHYVEWDMGFSSGVGANDGFSHWWVDGTEYGNHTGLDNDTHNAAYLSYGVRYGFNAGDTGYLYMDQMVANNDGSTIGPMAAGETLSITIDPNTSFKDGLRVI